MAETYLMITAYMLGFCVIKCEINFISIRFKFGMPWDEMYEAV